MLALTQKLPDIQDKIQNATAALAGAIWVLIEMENCKKLRLWISHHNTNSLRKYSLHEDNLTEFGFDLLHCCHRRMLSFISVYRSSPQYSAEVSRVSDIALSGVPPFS